MIGEERYCSTCGHRCHCYGSYCTTSIGVGMTDKWQECKCEKCKCDIVPFEEKQNRQTGPGGSTQRLHHKQFHRGGETGSTGIVKTKPRNRVDRLIDQTQ